MVDLTTQLRELVAGLEADADDDERTRDELIAAHGERGHPDIGVLGAVAEIMRDVADDIRRALNGAA